LTSAQHPSFLSSLQQYKQARSILKITGRTNNPAWYQESLEQNLQLHIRTDGMSIATIYYDRTSFQWSQGPYLTEEILRDPARRDSFVAETLEQARQSGATSLGVILHVGDDFATTELRQEFNNAGSLNDLRQAAIDEPASILADSSIQADQSSWRVFPYPAAKGGSIGTAVTMTQQYAPLFESFRLASENAKFPMITHALSAPLVAIMGLGNSIKPTPGKPFIAILQYPWLTALAFFNEQSDLSLIRTLQHRGLRRPNNFINSLATAQASLELVDPDLFVVPLGGKVDITLISDLKNAYGNSRVEEVQQVQVEGIPSWCPEPVISTQATNPGSASINSHTFSILREDKWALQNFLPTPKEIAQIYPSLSEIKLLKFASLARIAAFAIGGLGIAYLGFGATKILNSSEWKFNPSQVDLEKGKLVQLNLEKQKSDHWNNLLEDRSKAWVNMEFFTRMFAEGGGVLITSHNYTAIPVTTGAVKGPKIGFSKQWKIGGFAQLKALDRIRRFNTRGGVDPAFAEIAQSTGNASFDPQVKTRNIEVNVKINDNTSYRASEGGTVNQADSTSYPYSFDLVITQSFEPTDPMAFTASKAP
jgi:hypothetical protein